MYTTRDLPAPEGFEWVTVMRVPVLYCGRLVYGEAQELRRINKGAPNEKDKKVLDAVVPDPGCAAGKTAYVKKRR